MRDSVTLVEGMENVKILLQYLYMDESHHIIVVNTIDVPLKISMDELGNFECINMNFPDLPPMKNYDFPISQMLAAISQLEESPATEFPATFKNRWEEIKNLTLSNVSLNRGYYGNRIERAKGSKRGKKNE